MASLSVVTDKVKYLSDVAATLGNIYGSPPASFILSTLNYYKQLHDRLSKPKYVCFSERIGVYNILKAILIIMKNSSISNALMTSAANLCDVFNDNPKIRPIISKEERYLALKFFDTYYMPLIEEIQCDDDALMIQGTISFPWRENADPPKELREHPICASCGNLGLFLCKCGNVSWCCIICSLSMFNSHKCHEKKSD